jgi:hypothetical protein
MAPRTTNRAGTRSTKKQPGSKVIAPNPSPSPNPNPSPEAYTLTPEREAAIVQEVATIDGTLVRFPGRLHQRIRWSGSIRIAAERDAAELVAVPFHGEPPLSLAEIHAQRDKIELLRVTESRFQGLRVRAQAAVKAFDAAAEEAGRHKETLLRAFDLRFRNEIEGQKRLSNIRAGAGDADFVQDVSDLLVLAAEESDFLAKCPRGEATAVARLRELSPQLSHLLSAKSMSPEAQEARQLRDGVFTLITQTERRLRIAADYLYRGTSKTREYAVFTAPPLGREDGNDGEEIPPALPETPSAGEEPTEGAPAEG